MEFRVGDTVRIKDSKECRKYYAKWYLDALKGKVGVVKGSRTPYVYVDWGVTLKSPWNHITPTPDMVFTKFVEKVGRTILFFPKGGR